MKAADAKDANAIATLYTEDATLLPPGRPPIKGFDNIRNFWKGFLDAGASDATLKTLSLDASGDLALRNKH